MIPATSASSDANERLRRALRPIVHRLTAIIFRQRAQLAPDRLLDRYRQGFFPMPGRFGQLVWLSPEQRAIMPLDERFHVPSNVRKLIRRGHFSVTFNQAFAEVIRGCAEPRRGNTYTWITPEIIAAYIRLHQLGHAHSVEVWRAGALVGGGYGLAIGGYFAGESMFARESDAAKVGLVYRTERLRERGFLLQDVQMPNNFSRQFGVVELPRAEFLALQRRALAASASFADRPA